MEDGGLVTDTWDVDPTHTKKSWVKGEVVSRNPEKVSLCEGDF